MNIRRLSPDDAPGYRKPRAIKVDGHAYPKNHMYLELSPS